MEGLREEKGKAIEFFFYNVSSAQLSLTARGFSGTGLGQVRPEPKH